MEAVPAPKPAKETTPAVAEAAPAVGSAPAPEETTTIVVEALGCTSSSGGSANTRGDNACNVSSMIHSGCQTRDSSRGALCVIHKNERDTHGPISDQSRRPKGQTELKPARPISWVRYDDRRRMEFDPWNLIRGSRGRHRSACTDCMSNLIRTVVAVYICQKYVTNVSKHCSESCSALDSVCSFSKS